MTERQQSIFAAASHIASAMINAMVTASAHLSATSANELLDRMSEDVVALASVAQALRIEAAAIAAAPASAEPATHGHPFYRRRDGAPREEGK